MRSRRKFLASASAATVTGIGIIHLDNVKAESYERIFELSDSYYTATRRGYDIRLESTIRVDGGCDVNDGGWFGSDNEGYQARLSSEVEIISNDGKDHEGEIELQIDDLVYDENYEDNGITFDIDESHHGSNFKITRISSKDDESWYNLSGELNHQAIVTMDDGFSTDLFTSDEAEGVDC